MVSSYARKLAIVATAGSVLAGCANPTRESIASRESRVVYETGNVSGETYTIKDPSCPNGTAAVRAVSVVGMGGPAGSVRVGLQHNCL